jgi:Cytochrome P460
MPIRILLVILALVGLAGYQLASSQKTGSSQKTAGSRTASFNGHELVDQTGNIRKPADYRDHYQSLGTWAVLDPKGNQLHVVYASPGAAEYYRKNGKFGDGTVLVKEIYGTDHAQMTTGDAYRASAMIQWFVMIKDEKKRYPGKPLWGDGWGWALFKADAPDKQVATDYKKDCIPCHIPAQSTDWTYVQGYPVLKSK